MHNLQELKIWQKAISLSTNIYELTSKFPQEEKYGLILQMRRSAISIPSNIAEGAGRNSDKEFIHFLSIANGSAFELETQLIISNKLKLIEHQSIGIVLLQLEEIQKMIYGFQTHLKKQK